MSAPDKGIGGQAAVETQYVKVFTRISIYIKPCSRFMGRGLRVYK